MRKLTNIAGTIEQNSIPHTTIRQNIEMEMETTHRVYYTKMVNSIQLVPRASLIHNLK